MFVAKRGWIFQRNTLKGLLYKAKGLLLSFKNFFRIKHLEFDWKSLQGDEFHISRGLLNKSIK